MKEVSKQAGVVFTLATSTLTKLMQEGCHKFNTSFHTMNARPARAIQWWPISKDRHQQQQQPQNEVLSSLIFAKFTFRQPFTLPEARHPAAAFAEAVGSAPSSQASAASYIHASILHPPLHRHLSSPQIALCKVHKGITWAFSPLLEPHCLL